MATVLDSDQASFPDLEFEFRLPFEEFSPTCSNPGGDFSFLFGNITADSQIDHTTFSSQITSSSLVPFPGDYTAADMSIIRDTSVTECIPTTEGISSTSIVTSRRRPTQAHSSSSEEESPPSSSSVNSPLYIKCSWPSCKKSFSNRRDYKYVHRTISPLITK